MCGVVAGVAERNIVPILLEGLKRLEYRGYDSAGLALVQENRLVRCRCVGKVAALAEKLAQEQIKGQIGIAHTRWATHGIPSEANAHPHTSNDSVAIVHNGIIENHLEIRQKLEALGYVFTSETDSEAIAHLIHLEYQNKKNDLLSAVQSAAKQLTGAFSLVVCATAQPDILIAVRRGSPLVIGTGIGEHFIASDSYSLLPVTHRFVYLQDGDCAVISRTDYQIYNAMGQPVAYETVESKQNSDNADKGNYKHFMQKEMFEQPQVIADTLEGRIVKGSLNKNMISADFMQSLAKIKQADIIACGTSYHAGLIIKFYLEQAGIRTHVEFASEYIYRKVAVCEDTLFICISQSGETADTLAALEKAKALPYRDYLGVCNVAESALVQKCRHVILTRAGREIGVASTKAFVTQLVVLHLLTMLIRQAQNQPVDSKEIQALVRLPIVCEQMLRLDAVIAQTASLLSKKNTCLYLGRGECYALAAEGALKLKELSYIQAEAHPCGELKHGPLALVDESMSVLSLIHI